ncbi:MAG: hypothetical protein QXE90_02870 [Candidatus Micrarchaeia archaeon]
MDKAFAKSQKEINNKKPAFKKLRILTERIITSTKKKMDRCFDIAVEAMSGYPVKEEEKKLPERRMQTSLNKEVFIKVVNKLENLSADKWVRYTKETSRVHIEGFSASMDDFKIILEKRVVKDKDRFRKTDNFSVFYEKNIVIDYCLEIRNGRILLFSFKDNSLEYAFNKTKTKVDSFENLTKEEKEKIISNKKEELLKKLDNESF